MKCLKCNSKKLMIYSANMKLELLDGKWVNTTPFDSISHRDRYLLRCKDCKNADSFSFEKFEITKCLGYNFSLELPKREFEKVPVKPFNIYNPTFSFDEIVLDLDHTLIVSFNFGPDDDREGDFGFEFNGSNYEVLKRPYLKEFIEFCKAKFSKVSVSTASVEAYAKNILENIGLEGVDLVSRKDLGQPERTLMRFDREFIKSMDNKVVVDDKSWVIYGENNTIIRVKQFWGCQKDDELKKVMEFLNQKQGTKLDFPK